MTLSDLSKPGSTALYTQLTPVSAGGAVTHCSSAWWCSPHWPQGHSPPWCMSAGRTCTWSEVPGHAGSTWWRRGRWCRRSAGGRSQCRWLDLSQTKQKLKKENSRKDWKGVQRFDVYVFAVWPNRYSMLSPLFATQTSQKHEKEGLYLWGFTDRVQSISWTASQLHSSTAFSFFTLNERHAAWRLSPSLVRRRAA